MKPAKRSPRHELGCEVNVGRGEAEQEATLGARRAAGGGLLTGTKHQ